MPLGSDHCPCFVVCGRVCRATQICHENLDPGGVISKGEILDDCQPSPHQQLQLQTSQAMFSSSTQMCVRGCVQMAVQFEGECCATRNVSDLPPGHHTLFTHRLATRCQLRTRACRTNLRTETQLVSCVYGSIGRNRLPRVLHLGKSVGPACVPSQLKSFNRQNFSSGGGQKAALFTAERR